MPVSRVKIETFRGLNNVQPDTSLLSLEKGVGQTYLTECNNFDLDLAGNALIRKGCTEILTGSYHSLYSEGEVTLARKGVTLVKLTESGGGLSETTLRTGLISSYPMRYTRFNNNIYYTDNVATGIVQNGVSRVWGINNPASPKLIDINGSLTKGTYLVAATFQHADGRESGSSEYASIDCQLGGIRIDGIQESIENGITQVNVYISDTNGTKLYLAVSLDNGVHTYYHTSKTPLGKELTVYRLMPPLPGHLIEDDGARIYIAIDNSIYRSQPFAPELFDFEDSFLFEGRIKLMVSVAGGMFVATGDTTWYMSSLDGDVTLSKVADFGAVEGMVTKIDGHVVSSEIIGSAAYWKSSDGNICRGLPGGAFQNLTENIFQSDVDTIGKASYFEANDEDTVIFLGQI